MFIYIDPAGSMVEPVPNRPETISAAAVETLKKLKGCMDTNFGGLILEGHSDEKSQNWFESTNAHGLRTKLIVYYYFPLL